MNATPRKPVPVEKELWSEESRNSLDYSFAPDFYEDKPFSCRACGLEGVFTAAQQKYTYEVKRPSPENNTYYVNFVSGDESNYQRRQLCFTPLGLEIGQRWQGIILAFSDGRKSSNSCRILAYERTQRESAC